MNRIIKFRAKRNDMDRWVYGDYFKTPLTDENSKADIKDGHFFLTGVTRHCIRQEHGVSFVIDENTLGQFTGLTDKNGVEIYEGDIVKSKTGSIGVVNFCEGAFTWIEQPLGNFESDNEDFDTKCWAEIIGNIHENENLLKNGK